MKIAHARKVRDVAPLACKTDKVDARVLAALCRRDLVPELWVPSFSDRDLRERLRRRAHLVRMRASAMNRIFGLLTQWGMRLSLDRLHKPDGMTLRVRHKVCVRHERREYACLQPKPQRRRCCSSEMSALVVAAVSR